MTEQDYCRATAFGLIRAADAALAHAQSLLNAAQDDYRDRVRGLALRVRVLGDDLHEALSVSDDLQDQPSTADNQDRDRTDAQPEGGTPNA